LIQGFEFVYSSDYFVLEILVSHLGMIVEEISCSDHQLAVVTLFAGNGASQAFPQCFVFFDVLFGITIYRVQIQLYHPIDNTFMSSYVMALQKLKVDIRQLTS